MMPRPTGTVGRLVVMKMAGSKGRVLESCRPENLSGEGENPRNILPSEPRGSMHAPEF